jgi:UDP-glucose 4-epimerase
MKVLITGGAGYIGSTVASALMDNGHTPILLDSLVVGPREFTRNRIFYEGDIADANIIKRIFSDHEDIYCVIHCAALIVVPESVVQPYKYYKENVYKSLELFKNLIDVNCYRLIFSSSASIYDATDNFQVTETSPLTANSPYARTKIMMEHILEDFCQAYPLNGLSLRYFNPIGADPAFRSGPYIKNPSHLLGNLVEVASGRKPVMEINGIDWPTRDGSAIRDFIHVWDLAEAHVLAVEKFDSLFSKDEPYCVINLGTQSGVTVKEFVKAFETVWGKELPKKETGPRSGDAIGAFANAQKAEKLLGWKVKKSIETGISDALAWDKEKIKILKPA